MEKEIPESQSPFASEPIGRLIVKFAVPRCYSASCKFPL